MMINLTHDECIAVIKVSELMRERFDTLSLKGGFAWEIFDDHVNLDDRAIAKEVAAQINNQQFDVSDFESSRQYEALSVNAAYLTNWDKATKNWRFDKGFNK